MALKSVKCVVILKNILSRSPPLTHIRMISASPVCQLKKWRVDRGLPVNKNAEGFLTDGPDYTFLDGRPTPLLHKQKLRMLKQQDLASKIVQLNSEINFAVEREKAMKTAKEEERERIISNRLKPKGKYLKK